ncbi:hypothetical protein DSO57_1016920 [Entomophthora muscae]|uniref:Uncharacterized protein n=1 Tax=Entomophthora muscae TaxID=34485 RepID=A0ACC2STG1_9FUNG|nr:hypothetical protein DSO57_1016920 [Entomophthora muscae]
MARWHDDNKVLSQKIFSFGVKFAKNLSHEGSGNKSQPGNDNDKLNWVDLDPSQAGPYEILNKPKAYLFDFSIYQCIKSWPAMIYSLQSYSKLYFCREMRSISEFSSFQSSQCYPYAPNADVFTVKITNPSSPFGNFTKQYLKPCQWLISRSMWIWVFINHRLDTASCYPDISVTRQDPT